MATIKLYRNSQLTDKSIMMTKKYSNKYNLSKKYMFHFIGLVEAPHFREPLLEFYRKTTKEARIAKYGHFAGLCVVEYHIF